MNRDDNSSNNEQFWLTGGVPTAGEGSSDAARDLEVIYWPWNHTGPDTPIAELADPGRITLANVHTMFAADVQRLVEEAAASCTGEAPGQVSIWLRELLRNYAAIVMSTAGQLPQAETYQRAQQTIIKTGIESDLKRGPASGTTAVPRTYGEMLQAQVALSALELVAETISSGVMQWASHSSMIIGAAASTPLYSSTNNPFEFSAVKAERLESGEIRYIKASAFAAENEPRPPSPRGMLIAERPGQPAIPTIIVRKKSDGEEDPLPDVSNFGVTVNAAMILDESSLMQTYALAGVPVENRRRSGIDTLMAKIREELVRAGLSDITVRRFSGESEYLTIEHHGVNLAEETPISEQLAAEVQRCIRRAVDECEREFGPDVWRSEEGLSERATQLAGGIAGATAMLDLFDGEIVNAFQQEIVPLASPVDAEWQELVNASLTGKDEPGAGRREFDASSFIPRDTDIYGEQFIKYLQHGEGRFMYIRRGNAVPVRSVSVRLDMPEGPDGSKRQRELMWLTRLIPGFGKQASEIYGVNSEITQTRLKKMFSAFGSNVQSGEDLMSAIIEAAFSILEDDGTPPRAAERTTEAWSCCIVPLAVADMPADRDIPFREVVRGMTKEAIPVAEMVDLLGKVKTVIYRFGERIVPGMRFAVRYAIGENGEDDVIIQAAYPLICDPDKDDNPPQFTITSNGWSPAYIDWGTAVAPSLATLSDFRTALNERLKNLSVDPELIDRFTPPFFSYIPDCVRYASFAVQLASVVLAMANMASIGGTPEHIELARTLLDQVADEAEESSRNPSKLVPFMSLMASMQKLARTVELSAGGQTARLSSHVVSTALTSIQDGNISQIAVMQAAEVMRALHGLDWGTTTKSGFLEVMDEVTSNRGEDNAAAAVTAEIASWGIVHPWECIDTIFACARHFATVKALEGSSKGGDAMK